MDKYLKKNLRKAVEAIKGAESVAIFSHMNPDGDSIGSALALGLSLIHTDKKVYLLCENPVPAHLQFLPASELVSSRLPQKVDLAIAVDCGSPRQLGRLKKDFFKARATIQIDHHDMGEGFGDVQVVEKDASAVGEVIYELLMLMKTRVTKDIASCLLTAIIIDTGFFRFASIRPKTFEICSRLIKTGVELREIVEESYWKKSVSKTRLMGYCLSNARLSEDGAVAWVDVSQKILQSFRAKISDLDNIADDLRSIEGVKVAVVFRETEMHTIRVSLRSSYGINVALIAKHFGGGGHHQSAGCHLKKSVKDKIKLLAEIRRLLLR